MKNDGFPKGVYVRIGSSTRRASPDYIEDLVREGSRLNFDEEPIQQDIGILSKKLLQQFYEREAKVNRLLADKVITPSGVARDAYNPTVTGVLFFTDDPHTYLPEASVICTSFRGDGTTFLRNPHVARIAHRMGLVEKLGSGIRLIFDSCKNAGLKSPQYTEGGDSVKVTFYFEHVRRAEQSDEEAILSLIQKQRELSIQEVIKYLEVSRNTATRKLNNLVNENKLMRVGKGPSVRYRALDDQ